LRSNPGFREPVTLSHLPALSESEDQHERLVDRAELTCIEAPGGPTESLWVDDRRLLDQDACLLALERDRRAEARRPSARRGGRDEDGAEVEELVSLDDNRVTSSALFVAAAAARCRQVKELAADHVSS
jgi:hypothetical protein